MLVPWPIAGEGSVVELTGSVEAAPTVLAALGAALAAYDALRHLTDVVEAEPEGRPAWWLAAAGGALFAVAAAFSAPAVLCFPNDTIAGAADLLWLADAVVAGVAGASLLTIGVRRARIAAGAWPIGLLGVFLALLAPAHAGWMASLPPVPSAPPIARPMQVGWPVPVGPEEPVPEPWVAAPIVATATQPGPFDLPVRLRLPGVEVVQPWEVRAERESGRTEFPLAVGERWTWASPDGDLTLEVVGAAVAYGRRDFVLVYTAEGVRKRFLAHTALDDVDGDVNFAMSADDLDGAATVDACSLQSLDDRFDSCVCVRHPERFGAAPGPVRCGAGWGYSGGGFGWSGGLRHGGLRVSGGSGMQSPSIWLKAYEPGGPVAAAPHPRPLGTDPAVVSRVFFQVPDERDAIDVLGALAPGLRLTTADVEAAARFATGSLDAQAAVYGVLYPAVTDPERYPPRFVP